MKTKKRPPGAAGITVRNLTRGRIPKASSIRKTVKRIFELEKKKEVSLSVMYVSDGRLRRINKRYLGRDAYTDVMAFSMREGKRLEGDRGYLGDVVISVDAAGRQAPLFASTRARELALYLIHGVLHLLGYDDRTEKDALRMRRRQEAVLQNI